MTETLRHQIRCDQCDQPMTWLGGRTRWEGDYEISVYDYACRSCTQVTATVSYRTLTPLDGNISCGSGGSR